MNELRRERIGAYIQEKGVASIKELNALYPQLSIMTIHRDLERLEKDGVIVRTRGGAMRASQTHAVEAQIETRLNANLEAKSLIAQKALQLIREGSTVFFDAGTSCLALAKCLPDMELNVFTSGIHIVSELALRSKPTINVCGGFFNRTNQALSGNSALSMLEHINIATAFIGASGYTDDSGFTCGQEGEMLVKRLVFKKAKTKVILMDSSKIGKLLPYTFGQIEDVDYIICDQDVPQDFVQQVNLRGKILL